MLGLGPMELTIILVVVLLIFGPANLPKLADALGKSIKNFRKAADGRDEIDVTPKKTLDGEREGKEPGEKH